MKSRSHVNAHKDKKIFKKTAMRTDRKNIPGSIVSRGGIRL